ncbi:hypothetical protein FZ934_25515 (plasmid) [Rhizobium grahamii]|uniref:Lipoprotein n=1 Tax=Rhizobium grahamii TaxID=1120045 RepID=A0A5Q0CGZ0_9HYPH|nr:MULTISPECIES: hypothetical protein [Rhizobium]QFY63600.1 hypothetical protein FZ934_25515 [Rhizobium grahamii]QRM51636.1 hypothetical protein F3Y33_20130 [Rhizobium sp. BG6]
MRPRKDFRNIVVAAVLTLGAVPLISSCTTVADKGESREDRLAAAGFVARPANTPEREAMLKRLLPNKLLILARGKTVNYVYADPKNCDCLYVGSSQAYGRYQKTRIQEKIANRQLQAAQTYADTNWDWSRWGSDIANFDGPFGPDIDWY